MTTEVHQTDRLADFFDTIHECSDKRSLTHGLHPYPAKFIPHIPRELIREFSSPGDTVLDPMCGSGTTLVEAALAGRNAIGVDLNPVAALISSAKTAILKPSDFVMLQDLINRLKTLNTRVEQPASRLGLAYSVALPNFRNRSHWFDDHVSIELAAARQEIQKVPSEVARTIALCAYSAMIVAVYRQESETRWVAKPKEIPHGDVFVRLINKLRDSLERNADYRRATAIRPLVVRADARYLPIRPESIDLIVTSPPYANSHDYYLYNKLRLFWLGYDVGPVQDAEIGSRNKHSDLKLDIDHYLLNMGAVLREAQRVLRSSGKAVFVVGDAVIRSEFFNMASELGNAARAVGLALGGHYSFAHKRFTSTFMSGFGTTRPKLTHVLIFRPN
jgi:DNA modification methylase